MGAGAERVNAQFRPLIVDDDGFAAAFIEAVARTECPDTGGGHCICSYCVGEARQRALACLKGLLGPVEPVS